MQSVIFTIDSNKDILEFIDKSVKHIFIPDYRAQNTLKWWESTVKVSFGAVLENISVRQMQFDIQTDLDGLKQILNFENNFLDIYQFSKAVPDSLVIDSLPENNRDNILRQNGLEYIIGIEHEFVCIQSIHPQFIQNLRTHPKFGERVIGGRTE